MLVVLICAVILLLVLWILLEEMKRPANYPPGPQWLPFVGNRLQLAKLSRALGGQHLAQLEWSNRHKTNVLGMKLGQHHVVTVFSYPIVRQVLTGEEYEGRPDSFFFRLRSLGTRNGVTFTDGELWNIQRNFVVRHLRNLGFGKKPMETMIRDEIPEILSVLKLQGSEQQIGRLLAPSVLNMLWSLVTGSRIPRDSPQLHKLLNLFDQRSKAFDMSGGLLNFYPWLRYLFPEYTGYNIIKKLNCELYELFMDTINEHHKTWYEGRSDDLVYSFISKMKEANGGSTTFTNEQLVMVCMDLFIGGAQTTSNTLDFAMLMMILHPDVQTKLHAEMDEKLEKGNFLEYADRHMIPYAEAVLMEVERCCHVTPVCGPRRVLKDTILDGYLIPKETTVMINLYSVHHDKDYWKDPEVFRPERFIDDSGKLSPKERLTPFGLGKRRCLGEALAKNCIFTFFVEIMRKYKVKLLPGSKLPTGVPLPGITLSPESYRAQFIER